MESFLKPKLKAYLSEYITLYLSTNKLSSFLNNDILFRKNVNKLEHIDVVVDNLIRLSYFQKYFHLLTNCSTEEKKAKSIEILEFLYDNFKDNKKIEKRFNTFLLSYGQANIALLNVIYEDYYKDICKTSFNLKEIKEVERIFKTNNMQRYLYKPLSYENEETKSLAIIASNSDSGNDISNIISSQTHLKIVNYLRQLGYEVEIEKRFEPYIVDIYLPKLNLIIEYLGIYHFYPYQTQMSEKDKFRDRYIKSKYNTNILYIPFYEYQNIDTDLHFYNYISTRLNNEDEVRFLVNKRLFREDFV